MARITRCIRRNKFKALLRKKSSYKVNKRVAMYWHRLGLEKKHKARHSHINKEQVA